MNAKQIIKKLVIEYNPVYVLRKYKMRRLLKNKEITLLCPNCLGGILFHDLDLKFNSPTVNLMMTQRDFLQMVFNLDKYQKGTLHFYEDSEMSCPCAYLEAENLPSLKIIFTHYNNDEEAYLKWNERYARIKRENMFICLQERDGITLDQIKHLSTLDVKGIVVFTAHEYDDVPYVVYIDKYKSDGNVGNILERNHFTGMREYEKYFDFVRWFNEANGKDYNVRPFIKRV